MFHDMFVHGFTICLFISPDLDGYRAPRGIYGVSQTQSPASAMFHDKFVRVGPANDFTTEKI